MQIEGTTALVTGGASGLGEATVRALLNAGAQRVVVADLNEDRGRALEAELPGVQFVPTDVTLEDDVREAVAHAEGLRISVSCAGIGAAEKTASRRGPHGLESFARVIAVNLLGSFNALRFASAAMISNASDTPRDGPSRGVCINTASIAAYDGQVGQIAYAASKGAIVAMTLPAARDLASSGVRVCTIAPGLFDTPLLAALPQEARDALGAQVPFPARLGHTDEYAKLACQIVENEMLNGEVVRLDGALRMPPR